MSKKLPCPDNIPTKLPKSIPEDFCFPKTPPKTDPATLNIDEDESLPIPDTELTKSITPEALSPNIFFTKSNPLFKKPSDFSPPAPNAFDKLPISAPSPNMLKIEAAPSVVEALSIIPPNNAGAAAISPFCIVSVFSPPTRLDTLLSTLSDNCSLNKFNRFVDIYFVLC